MSRIDDLIKQYAPSGVPQRPLGEVGTFIRGRRFTKDDMVDAGVPCIHYGEIYTHYGVSATETLSHVREEIAGSLRFAQPGDVIIAGVGETVEEVAKAVAWLGATKVAIHDDSYAFRSAEDPTYIAYAMQTADFHTQKEKYVARAKVKRVGGENLGKIVVPVPPLEVQREIVRILDAFTELEAELEAELSARRAQYRHFKDHLLAAAPSDRHIALRDCTQYVRGLTYSKTEEVRDGSAGTAVLRSNNVDLGSNRLNFDDVRVVKESVRVRDDQWLKQDDILVSAGSGSRAHVGKAAFIEHDLAHVFGGFMAVVRSDSRVNPRFLFHHLTSQRFGDYLDTAITSTTINNLTSSIMGAFTIPLPPTTEQLRVADLLDKFDALVNDLSSGLPAEIEARRQQYAYYRDRLLTFEEAAA